MALDSVTVEINTRTVFGNKRVVFASLTLGNDTFPAAGLDLTPEQLSLKHVDLVLIEGKKMDYFYDYDNQKLKAYVPADTTGAAYVKAAVDGATPNETVKALVIGYGG